MGHYLLIFTLTDKQGKVDNRSPHVQTQEMPIPHRPFLAQRVDESQGDKRAL